MAEALGLTSSVVTLVATAYSSCQTIYNIVDGLRGAHEQLLTLSSDLISFQNVLDNLQLALQDDTTTAAAVERLMSNTLSSSLKNSLNIFQKTIAAIRSCQAKDKASRLGFWQKTKWVFIEKKIATLTHELMQCKTTLNLAICMANA